MAEYDDLNDEVVGGIGKHAFCLINGYQILPNTSFENNTTGWTEVGSSVITRTLDDEAPLGNYCLKIQDNNVAAQEYVKTAQIDPYNGATLENKLFLCTFWARADAAGHVTVEAVSNDSDVNLQSVDAKICETFEDIWRPHYFLFAIPNEADATEFHLRFHPYWWTFDEDDTSTGTAYIDRVNLYKVGYYKEIRQATSMTPSWKKEISADYIMGDGSNVEYCDGMRVQLDMFWDYLDQENELVKSAIYGTPQVFVIPHKDYDWGIMCKPQGNDKRQYLKNKYIGHTAQLSFLGIDLLGMKNAQLMEENLIPKWDFNFASMHLGDNLPWNTYTG